MADDISEIDYFGNRLSDGYADFGAALTNETKDSTSSAALGMDFLRGRASCVLRRLVEIQRVASAKLDDTRLQVTRHPVLPRRPMLIMLLEGTDHVFKFTKTICSVHDLPKVLKCQECKGCVPRAAVVKWLRGGRCPGPHLRSPATLSGAAASAPHGVPVRIGNRDLHPTHAMLCRTSIWWCSACGAYSSTAGTRTCARALRAPCAGQPTAAGAYALRRLHLGLPPRPATKKSDDGIIAPAQPAQVPVVLGDGPPGDHGLQVPEQACDHAQVDEVAGTAAPAQVQAPACHEEDDDPFSHGFSLD